LAVLEMVFEIFPEAPAVGLDREEKLRADG